MLFAAIVGSSVIGESRDPEVVRAALGRTFDAISEVLGAHGGTIEKFIDDEGQGSHRERAVQQLGR